MQPINHLVRQNPELLGAVLQEARIETAAGVATILLSATTDKRLVNPPTVGVGGEMAAAQSAGEFAWGASHAGTSKAVFQKTETPMLGSYLAIRKEEFLAAFSGSIKSATRYAICARIFADLGRAIDGRDGFGPFTGLPYVEVMGFLATGAVFERGLQRVRPAIKAKPSWITDQSPAYRIWGQTRSSLEVVLDETCQMIDLIPAKDLSVLRQGEAEALLGTISPERLFEILQSVIASNPAPVPATQAELERAIGDFLVPSTGKVAAAQAKRQMLWMRGLMESPIRYAPCSACGFPAFYDREAGEVGAKSDHGWQAGAIGGAGWQPGTPESGTVIIPVCLCCKAEKIIVEDGLKHFGKHPILVYNLGDSVISRDLYESIWTETWMRLPNGKDKRDKPSTGIAPGGHAEFGNMGNRMENVKSLHSTAFMRKKLTYAYFALRAAGHSVAFALPTEPIPCGIFGWAPPETSQEEAHKIAKEALVHLRISRLPFRGFSGKNENYEGLVAREKSLISASFDFALRTLMDAMRGIDTNQVLGQAIKDIFSLNGGHPMRLANTDLLAEAAFWAEVAHPLLSNRKDIYFNKGASTKAFSEAIDAMQRVSQTERVGIGMAAITRNLNPYLKAQDGTMVQALMAEVQNRLTRYADLNQADLQALRNAIDPMIRAAIRHGIRYTPTQNNFCTTLRRRLNDPDGAETPLVDEDEAATATATSNTATI